MRIGQGYDIHSLSDGPGILRLGGFQVEAGLSLTGHSDADVLIHAVSDAILGASGLGDLGTHFPSTDERWRDVDSRQLLSTVLQTAQSAGLRVGNLDSTVVAQRPRLAQYREEIERSLAACCGLDASFVNVKLKSNEGFDATGRGEAIAAYAVALLVEDDR